MSGESFKNILTRWNTRYFESHTHTRGKVKNTPRAARFNPVSWIQQKTSDEKVTEAWSAWIEMRSAIKKPLKTERAAEMAYKRLLQYSAGDVFRMVQIIENAVLNNWQSFYPLRNGFQDSKPAQTINIASINRQTGAEAI